MTVELGSVLSGIGNAAGSLGRACIGIAERGGAASVSGTASLTPAFEAAPSMAGGIFRAGLDFRGPQLSILSAPVIKEGPVSIFDLKNSAKVQTSVINPLGEIRFSPEATNSFYPKPETQVPEAPSEQAAAPYLKPISFQEPVSQAQSKAVLLEESFRPNSKVSLDPVDVLAEAEAILKDVKAQVPEQNQLYVEPVKENLKPIVQESDIKAVHPVVKSKEAPQPAKIILFPQESAAPEAARIMQVRRLIEIQPKVSPLLLPDFFPEPSPAPFAAASPASGLKAEKRVYSKPAVSVSAQSVLDEEEVLEEAVTQRPTSKEIDIVEEASESILLKEVVDEQVMDKRIYEFGEAIEEADFEVEVISAEGAEKIIDGSRVAELAGPETKDNRSGLVKDDGPDGSRVEVIEEAKGKKYKSKKQAKDEIFAAIFQKPPVKRAIEGREAGREAVMRVLKFLLVRYLAPAKQEAVKIFKKRTVQKTGLPVKPVDVGFLQQEREEQAEGNTIGTLNLKDIFPKAA